MDLGAILRDADGDIIGIKLREIKTRQRTGGASYSELEKLGGPDILRELVRLDRLNDTALSEELADLFRVGIPPDLIKSQIVRYAMMSTLMLARSPRMDRRTGTTVSAGDFRWTRMRRQGRLTLGSGYATISKASHQLRAVMPLIISNICENSFPTLHRKDKE